MRKDRSIWWKALFMLVVFAANFLVFCHCAARAEAAVGHHSCCEKRRSGAPKHSDCQGMQAVRFNLVEKQVASSVVMGELPVVVLDLAWVTAPVERPVEGFRRADWWASRYAPPDLQVLYQRFLI